MAKINVKNRTIFTRDNLEVMRGMTSDSVDLIYLDPPFNSNHNYGISFPNKKTKTVFKDIWYLSDIDEEWIGSIADEHPKLYSVIMAAGKVGGDSVKSYLIYMSIRILEMHRILKKTGSIYLHCDPTMSHYIKLVLDSIFGRKYFKNEITWKRHYSHNDGKKFGRISDIILFYTKSQSYLWNKPYVPYSEEDVDLYFKRTDERGRYQPVSLTAESKQGGGYEYEYYGHYRLWTYPKKSMLKLERDGRIHFPKKKNGVPRMKFYMHESEGKLAQNIWTDIERVRGKEKQDYPTQKPLALLERIIGASSNKGDMVFDPFCGGGTTCIAADRLERKWVGIDISPMAHTLINRRIKRHGGLDLYRESSKGWNVIQRTDVPKRGGMRSKNIKHDLFGIQEGICNGCDHDYQFKDLEVDHIIPQSRHGEDVDKNLQLLCGSCNKIKGGRLTMEELWAELRKKGYKKGKKNQIRTSKYKLAKRD